MAMSYYNVMVMLEFISNNLNQYRYIYFVFFFFLGK